MKGLRLEHGLGLGSGLVDDGAPAAPSAFTAGQWTLGDSPSAGGDTLTINITALPVNGGSPITALEYRLNGGAATALVGVGTGARDITVPAVTEADVEIRAVNAIGNGAWSDLKSVTPTVETPADPPVLTQISYVGDDLELEIDIDGTGYWKWSASATPLTGAAIKAAPDGTEAWFGPGTVLETIADPGPGTWYLNLVAENVAGFSNVITITEVVPGQTFLEDWSSYAVGNTFTELDAAYSRTNTAITASIVSNADGPDGKACQLTNSGVASLRIWRDDIATALGLRTTERVQFLFKVKFTTLASSRNALGMVSGNNVWGVNVSRFGGGHAISAGNSSDFTSASPYNMVSENQTDGDVFYIRIEIDGVNVRVRDWEPATPESEGGTWTQDLAAGSAVTVTNCSLAQRITGNGLEVLGYSVGIDADAPSF